MNLSIQDANELMDDTTNPELEKELSKALEKATLEGEEATITLVIKP